MLGGNGVAGLFAFSSLSYSSRTRLANLSAMCNPSIRPTAFSLGSLSRFSVAVKIASAISISMLVRCARQFGVYVQPCGKYFCSRCTGFALK